MKKQNCNIAYLGLLFLALSTISCQKERLDAPLDNEEGVETTDAIFEAEETVASKESRSETGKVVNTTTGATVKSITLDVSLYEKFIYFSFETGALVPITDEESRRIDNWDLGFHRTDIRTNSGESTDIGIMGGAVETDAVLLSQDVTIPSDDKFETDNKFIVSTYHTDEEGVRQEYLPANPALTTRSRPYVNAEGKPIRGANGFIQYEIQRRGALIMDRSSMPPSLEFSNKVYIVRTAKGKYAKIKIVKYRRKPGTPPGDPDRLLTMEYVYPFEMSKAAEAAQ